MTATSIRTICNICRSVSYAPEYHCDRQSSIPGEHSGFIFRTRTLIVTPIGNMHKERVAFRIESLKYAIYIPWLPAVFASPEFLETFRGRKGFQSDTLTELRVGAT